MMYGIWYRGKHSNEFGVICKTKKRPAIAPVRTIEETVPYRDGSLDFSTQGGRLFYDDKLVEIEMTIPDGELRETQKKISKVVQWIAGDFGDLIFDDMPYTVWKAKPMELGDVATELYRVGRVTVQFRCKPFNNLIFHSTGVLLDTPVSLDSDVPIGYGEDSTISFSAGDNENVSYAYKGDVPVRPQLVVNSDASKIRIKINEKVIEVQTPQTFKSYGGIIVDCENWKCLGGNGDNLTAYTSGCYPEFLPGENMITIDQADDDGVLYLNFYSQFYYGGDIDVESV